MPIFRIIAATAIATGLYLATNGVSAQGGSETPRPQSSNPSATVDRLQGLPPPPAGAPGNPTGNPRDRAAVQPPANARAANPSNVPGNLGTQGTENRPASPGRSQPASPTN